MFHSVDADYKTHMAEETKKPEKILDSPFSLFVLVFRSLKILILFFQTFFFFKRKTKKVNRKNIECRNFGASGTITAIFSKFLRFVSRRRFVETMMREIIRGAIFQSGRSRHVSKIKIIWNETSLKSCLF